MHRRPAHHDRVGAGHRDVRLPDPRLHALVEDALTGARTVVDVGAGAGPYEPRGARVTAVDPSRVMLDQHPGARRIRARAEQLPFPDGTFDAAMAVMTIHHWPDPARGLAELRRVSRRQVVFTWDPAHRPRLWLVEEYLPEIREMDEARFAPVADVAAALGAHRVHPFPIPHDFTDGFPSAYWRRPESFLDPLVRAADSTFAVLSPDVVDRAVSRLRADLKSRAWYRRHADLLSLPAMDYGYRLLVAGD